MKLEYGTYFNLLIRFACLSTWFAEVKSDGSRMAVHPKIIRITTVKKAKKSWTKAPIMIRMTLR